MFYYTVKLTLRKIQNQKEFFLISILGLTLGITVSLVIAHITIFELSFDKYHNDYQDVYRVQNNRIYQNLNDESAGCPPATGPALKNEIPDIMESARIKPLTNSILEITQAEKRSQFYHSNLFYADNSIFRIFTWSFISGNADDALKEINTAVVTRGFGLKYFGKENVLGEKFKCSNNEGMAEYTIKAVIDNIPDNSYLNFDCFLSYTNLISQNSDAKFGWGWNAFNTFVRLKPNSDAALVNQKLASVISKYNLTAQDHKRIFTLQPIENLHLHSNLRHEIGRRGNAFMIYLLISIAIFILLVAWINYINLSTSKSRKQVLESNVKKFLGETRSQIFYEHVFEAFVINFVALIISIIVIKTLSQAFKNWYSVELYSLEIVNWIIVILSTFLVSMISGLYPAFAQSGKNKSIGNKHSEIHHKSLILRNGLVVFQFVVSIVFIVATVLIIKQIKYMEKKQDELAINNIITLKSLANNQALQKSQKAFIAETLKIPGIVNLSVSTSIPGGDFSNVLGAIRPLGKKAEGGIKCFFIDVNENFFDLYNIGLIAGNKFKNNGQMNDGMVIINAMASKMLGFDKPSDAIDRKLILGEYDNQTRTILGVVEDYHQKSLQESIHPSMFNYQEIGNYISMKYSNQLSSTIIGRSKESWEKIFPDQPFDYFFNDQYYSAQYDNDRIFGRLVCTFAILIIFISCIGLYSLARFAINNRIKEIGIRKVNGAKSIEMITMLNKDFIKWVIIAFVIACPIAFYAMYKWLQSFAYKTDLSWWVFVIAGGIALVIALITVSWQSWRAASRNPVEALRYE